MSMKHLIKMFMWGYQPHFRVTLELLAESVFKELGVKLRPDVLLVGARRPGHSNDNPVCVEPEYVKWELTLFKDLLESIEKVVSNHPLQRMHYGDEPSMRDKPENIRRDSARTAVRDALRRFDTENEVKSFCGSARPLGDYYVVPVIQIPEVTFRQFPPLNIPSNSDRYAPQGERSLIHSSIDVLLEEASAELLAPEPGRSVGSKMRRADEIVHTAASNFLRIPAALISAGYAYDDLFERFNIISSLFYEGAQGTGRMLLVNPENTAIDYVLRFKESVPFRKPRWARKILQMATPDISLIADGERIYGLGTLKADHDEKTLDCFTINFLDHYQWELSCGHQVLMYSRYREPRLPQGPISMDLFKSNYHRLFHSATSEDSDRIWGLYNAAALQRHGSMIVVSEDAESESNRLAQQGTGIDTTLMTPELLARVSGIDGSIIIDPHCYCYAVGVILDGEAVSECTPSRGSRYNSALRYVLSTDHSRLAIVFSEDRTVDIIPILKPQIPRGLIGQMISELANATLENYHKSRNWLDEHRFYLNAEECEKVNQALERIENLPKEMGVMVIITPRFEVDPQMDDTFFSDD